MKLRHIDKISIPLLIIATAGVAGCSTMAPPKAELDQARISVEDAQQNEADRFAAVALNRAKDRISQAEEAMEQEDYKLAKQLAEKATADARLASATAQTEKTRKALDEVNSSLNSLGSELDIES